MNDRHTHAPSLLPRVLAVLDAEYHRRGGDDGGGYVGALAAELRRYIAEQARRDSRSSIDWMERYDAAEALLRECEGLIASCGYLAERLDHKETQAACRAVLAKLQARTAARSEGET